MNDRILLTQLRDLCEQAVAFAAQYSDVESVNLFNPHASGIRT